jgi:hypothetical protein
MVRTLHVRIGASQGRDTLVMGSYEPDENTTGVPAGTSLTNLTGNQIITTPGTTLFRRNITGYVDVRAADVTIKECRIWGDPSNSTNHGLITARHADCINLVIEDNTIDPGSSGTFWMTGIIGHDFTSRRNRIKNVVDPIGIYNDQAPGSNSNVLVEADFLGPCAWFTTPPDTNQVDGSHNDVIQIQGGVGTEIRYSKLWGKQSTEVGNGASGGRQGATQTQSLSCIQFNDNVGDPYDVYVHDNWLYGGEISVNGSDSSMTAPVGEVVATFYRNRFDRSQWFYPQNVQLYLLDAAEWDTGAGTANKNYFMDNGQEVTVNYV